ncbi:MAG: NAD-dependent epimerase/dehydratase family protein [Bacteroidota bacterium]
MPTYDASARPGSEPVPVLTGSPLLVVLNAMDSAGVQQAVVVRQGASLGMVSQDDIRRAVRGGLDLRTPVDRMLAPTETAPAETASARPASLPTEVAREAGALAQDPTTGQGVPFVRPRADIDAREALDPDALPAVPLFDSTRTESPAQPASASPRIPDPELVVPPRPAPAADRGPSAQPRTPAERMVTPPPTPTASAITASRSADEEVPRIVVTGGAGYIGSILVRQLLDEGFRVTVFDRMMHGDDYLQILRETVGPSMLDLVEGDVRHIDAVEPHLRGATAVLHLADLDGIDLVRTQPEEALQTNVLATAALAQAASYLRVRRFVYASTTALYKPPRTATSRIDEDAPLHAASLYAKLKRAAETLVLDQSAPHFAPTVLRLGDVFGPSPRPRLDTILNDVAMQATRDVRVILRAESHAIPAVHVEDAARSFLHVLGAPANHVAHQVFNVVGANVTVLALEQLLRDQVPEIRVLYTDAEPGTGVAVGRVSGEKAHKWLGFAPQQRFAESLHDLMAAIASGYARDLPLDVTHNAMAYDREVVEVG